ncbi:MAG: hypothetical protein ABMA00_14690, partial [Gemmatimonas sp.]
MEIISAAVSRAAALSLLGALMIPGSGVAAQSTANATGAAHDSRWQPWLGCWKPVGAMTPVISDGESISAAAPTMLCIVPGRNATSVEVVNFSGGAITER